MQQDFLAAQELVMQVSVEPWVCSHSGSMLLGMTMRNGQDDNAAEPLRALQGIARGGMGMISRVAWALLAGHDSRVA